MGGNWYGLFNEGFLSKTPDGEWSRMKPLSEYPRPAGSVFDVEQSTDWSSKYEVLSTNADVEINNLTYYGCYVVKYSDSYDLHNGGYGTDESTWVFYPRVGLIKYTSKSVHTNDGTATITAEYTLSGYNLIVE